jgi:hypothetical protein
LQFLAQVVTPHLATAIIAQNTQKISDKHHKANCQGFPKGCCSSLAGGRRRAIRGMNTLFTSSIPCTGYFFGNNRLYPNDEECQGRCSAAEGGSSGAGGLGGLRGGTLGEGTSYFIQPSFAFATIKTFFFVVVNNLKSKFRSHATRTDYRWHGGREAWGVTST